MEPRGADYGGAKNYRSDDNIHGQKPQNRSEGGMLVMPDGSVVPVPSGATSRQRSDVSSVERLNMATGYAPVFDSAQEKPLPPKPAASASGPAPGSSSQPPAYYPPSHVPTSKPPYQYAYAGEAMPAKSNHLAGATGRAPEPGYYNPSYPIPTSMQQPAQPFAVGATHAPFQPSKLGAPIPGPAPERQAPIAHHSHVPVQHSQLHQVPAVQQQPASFPQARPYQTPAGPYTVYQPPAPVVPQTPPATTPQKKPIKTSKEFDTKTLDDNQYFISIILCITLTIFCNPFTLFCCIPAFYYASKAAEEKKDDYEKALGLHKKAQWLNAGGFIFIVVGGTFFLIFISIVAGVGGAIASASTTG